MGNTNHALSGNNNYPSINKFFWEHHIRENYLHAEDLGEEEGANGTVRESMDLFWRTRQKGIWAHSWVSTTFESSIEIVEAT